MRWRGVAFRAGCGHNPRRMTNVDVDAPRLIVVRHAQRELFLISFLILFLELACIRWLSSAVVFLTFFTNTVLLATFLGMSVGCMTAGRRRNFARWVLPLLCVTVA